MVRYSMPEVAVVPVPEDPSDYVSALQEGLWFESSALTDEDRKRSHFYHAEAGHRAAMKDAEGLDDYLLSLCMRATVRLIDSMDMQRIVQLLGKTNQFNVTTRRHTAEELSDLLSRPGSIGLSLRLEDRLSDHGLVALVLGVEAPLASEPTMEIDSFLMSCRVIGRTVEVHLLQSLIDRAYEAGYHRIIGRYLPTPKNYLVAPFFERMGFSHIASDDRTGECFELKLPLAEPLQSKVIEKG
jgi:FkbH-like protein